MIQTKTGRFNINRREQQFGALSFPKLSGQPNNMAVRISLSVCIHFTLLTLSVADIKLIKNHDGDDPTNPEPCLRTCGGSTGYGKTTWTGSGGYLKTTIDISKCGFVAVPIVTTSLNGRYSHWYQVGMSSPRDMTKSEFGITVVGEALTAWDPNRSKISSAYADSYNWNINWIALGFTC